MTLGAFSIGIFHYILRRKEVLLNQQLELYIYKKEQGLKSKLFPKISIIY